MKSKFLITTISISLALFAIYLTVFYSKKSVYDFNAYPNFYEYMFHAIILILPTIVVIVLFYNRYIKNQATHLEEERLINNNLHLINDNLHTQLTNYEKEIERVHEKYVNLSIEADAIMIKFNDVVETLINSQIERLDKGNSKRELIPQMFYDLLNPIRVKLSNLKTITATAIESLKKTELNHKSIKREYEELLEKKEQKIKNKELTNSKKDNLIILLKENESEYKRTNSSLKEKIRDLEIKNQILNDKLKRVDFSENELLIEIEKLQKENSEVLGLLDKVKPYRKKYSK